jgi:hypothetical protein
MQQHVPFRNLNPIKYDVYLNLPISLENWDVYTFKKSNYSYNENSDRRGLMEHTAVDEYYCQADEYYCQADEYYCQADEVFPIKRLTERQVYFSNRKRHYAAIKIQREYRRTYATNKWDKMYNYCKTINLSNLINFLFGLSGSDE